jgi:hypothetical protein
MDGGFRRPQPVERRAASRQESTPAPRQPEVAQAAAVQEEPKTTRRASAPHTAEKKQKLLKRFLWPILVVVIIVLGVVGYFAFSKMSSAGTGIDSSKYQAVFFTNGQVYFGKLQSFNNEYMKLTNIYYLQSQQATTDADPKNPQATSSDQNGVQLIKLGSEIHGPEDEMIISKDQMLFYENLKSDSKVAQSIDKYKKSN